MTMDDTCTCMEKEDDSNDSSCAEDLAITCRDMSMVLDEDTCTCMERDDNSANNGECTE